MTEQVETKSEVKDEVSASEVKDEKPKTEIDSSMSNEEMFKIAYEQNQEPEAEPEVKEPESEETEEQESREETPEEAEEPKPEEDPETPEPKTDEPEKKEEPLILGKFKTEEDLNAHIQETVNKREQELKQETELKEKEEVYNTNLSTLKNAYAQIDQEVANFQEKYDNGEISLEQLRKIDANSGRLKAEIEQNYAQLQQQEFEYQKPKIIKENTEIYNKYQSEIPELKDPIVKKWADKLKTEIFDASGTKIDDGFKSYVGDYIAGVKKEAENAGYQKALADIQHKKDKKKMMNGSIAGKKTVKAPKKSEEQLILDQFGL